MITDLPSLLAVQVAADAGDTVSTKILYGVISVIVTAAVGAMMRHQGKQLGRKEERDRVQGNVTIDSPIPEVTTREAPRYAERGTTEEKFKAVAEDIDQIHTRINALFRVVNNLEGQFEGVNQNVGRLLDRAMGLPPGTSVPPRQRKTPN